MEQWQEQRMQMLYEVLRTAQDLILYKNPDLPHEWKRHGEAWLALEAAVKRVVDHSKATRDTDTNTDR